MGWFPPREWAYVNIANSVAPFAGLALVFAVMPVVYAATGKQWTTSMLYAGLALGLISLAAATYLLINGEGLADRAAESEAP